MNGNRHEDAGRQPGNDPARAARTQIIMEATYFAACYGWFDTSEAAQRANLLTVDMMDMVIAGETFLPEGATDKVFICIDNTSCIVTRYAGGHYEVMAYDQTEPHRQERELRKRVMDCALEYFSGYSPDPRPEEQEEARNEAIQALLEGVEPDQDSGPVAHPVMREEPPTLFLVLAGDEAQPGPRVQRQWAVYIGPSSCSIGLVKYTPEGTPELIARARDAEQSAEDGTQDDAGVNVAWTMVKSLYPDAQGEELVTRLKEFQAVLDDPSMKERRRRAYEAYLSQREEPE
jgi:hypothetical protein